MPEKKKQGKILNNMMEQEEEELTVPNIQAQGDHEHEKNKVIPQIIATLISNIGSFGAGCVFGWTSPIIPKLKSKDSPLSVTMDDISWIGSLPSLGAMFGPFLGAYGSENIGRKLTMLLITAPWTLSWVLVSAAPETITVFVGRFTQGLSFGAFFAVLPSYVGEISQENIRGLLSSMSQIFITFGLLSQYCIGPWVSYHALTIGCVFVSIVFAILFVFMPESPYFYFSKNRNDYALKSLKWLRGHDDVNRELERIQDAVVEEMKNRGTYKDLFGNRVNLRALILVAAFGPIPWLMMSEMFAMNIRSKGAGVASCVCWILSFCITRAFFPLEALIGPHFTVWMLGLFCAISGLGVYFFVPETKGKTLHEIQLLLGAQQE